MTHSRLLLVVAILASLLMVPAAVGCRDTEVASSTSGLSRSQSTTQAASFATTPTTAAVSSRTVAEQRERFEIAHKLAQGGLVIIDRKRPPAPDWSAELIVYGKVVKVDTLRWNTPDGQKPASGKPRDAYVPTPYTTFYVQPTLLKGSPRFGTPIAIMTVEVSERYPELLSEGDEVLVFAEYGQKNIYRGTWKQDAYFPLEMARGIYMKVGEQYLNLESGQPCQQP